MTEINLKISGKNECTASPYWLILDPRQMMKPDIYVLANMITGPFFSREEAESVLRSRRHHYSNRAKVFCHSGCYSVQYDKAYKNAELQTRTNKGVEK